MMLRIVRQRHQFRAALAQRQKERAEQGQQQQPVAHADTNRGRAAPGPQHETHRQSQDVQNNQMLQPEGIED
jgi:hypothetical protein